MKPTQTLPKNFIQAWNLELKHHLRLNVILQIVGLGWMALSGWLLVLCVTGIRPDLRLSYDSSFGNNPLLGLGLVVAVMVVAIVLHELVHGLFFQVFTGHRPEYGIGTGYAFAAMPDWYFPKKQYLVIGLSPLVLLTVLGLLLCLVVPTNWLAPLVIGMVINAGGAIGDMYICWRIGMDESDVWVKDTGDGFQLYRRRLE
jgi:hypothetical protein